MRTRLDTKYGTNQKLIDCIISNIKRLPESNNNAQSQLEMIRTIEAASNDLKCIDSVEDLNNSTVLSMVEQRMSNKMHDEWVKLAIKTPTVKRYEALVKFLDNWKIRIEYENAEIRIPSRENSTNENSMPSKEN